MGINPGSLAQPWVSLLIVLGALYPALVPKSHGHPGLPGSTLRSGWESLARCWKGGCGQRVGPAGAEGFRCGLAAGEQSVRGLAGREGGWALIPWCLCSQGDKSTGE